MSWISGARPLPAVNVSSPPLTLTTRFSVVPMSRLKGAGVDAVEADSRCRWR